MKKSQFKFRINPEQIKRYEALIYYNICSCHRGVGDRGQRPTWWRPLKLFLLEVELLLLILEVELLLLVVLEVELLLLILEVELLLLVVLEVKLVLEKQVELRLGVLVPVERAANRG